MIAYFFLFKQKTAYELRISDWSSDVCSSDLVFYFSSTIARNALALIQVMSATTKQEHFFTSGNTKRVAGTKRFARLEPHLDLWRLQLLREWGHGTQYLDSTIKCNTTMQKLDRKSTRLNSSH